MPEPGRCHSTTTIGSWQASPGPCAPAFSAYFQLRYLEESDEFDARAGVNHERPKLRDEQGTSMEHDLWTTCFTPRELRLLAATVGLDVEAIWSVEPGRYARTEPIVDLPEFLLVASKS